MTKEVLHIAAINKLINIIADLVGHERSIEGLKKIKLDFKLQRLL